MHAQVSICFVYQLLANPSICCPYGFSAGPNWDAVTGLGTINFMTLRNHALNPLNKFPDGQLVETALLLPSSVEYDFMYVGVAVSLLLNILVIILLVALIYRCRRSDWHSTSSFTYSSLINRSADDDATDG